MYPNQKNIMKALVNSFAHNAHQNKILLLKQLFKTRLRDGDNADHVSKIVCLFKQLDSCGQTFDDNV